MNYQDFFMYLDMSLLNEKPNGCFTKIESKYNVPLELNPSHDSKYNLPKAFFEVYRKTNGMLINWEAKFNANNVYGRTCFLPYNQVVSSWKDEIFIKEDTEKNELIEFFHPFDLVTDEAQCGFIIKPNETFKSIYYNKSGYTETERLELDFEGYVKMLYESRAYHHWPLAILHIINNEESKWLSDFKNNITHLFSGFKWAKYEEAFNLIRLDR